MSSTHHRCFPLFPNSCCVWQLSNLIFLLLSGPINEPESAGAVFAAEWQDALPYFHLICWYYNNSGFRCVEIIPHARYFTYIILNLIDNIVFKLGKRLKQLSDA